MRTARVKAWFNSPGYGFLMDEESDVVRDVFVHHTAIEMQGFRHLIPGELVDYEVEDGPRGPFAKVVYPRPLERP